MNYIEELNNIKKKIDDSQYVSFDVFDTLLLRNVYNPCDIFKIVELEYFIKFNEKIEFYKIRIKSEEIARINSKFEDVTLDEIYTYVNYKLGEKANELKKLEIEMEKKFILVNEGLKNIYDYAKRNGKHIFIISDMYLGKNIIEELLNESGYYNYDKLYVSSEIKKTKAKGTIYSHIRQENLIDDSKKWVHIGDNYLSDVLRARENKIEAIYYQRILDRVNKCKISNLSESILFAIKTNQLYNVNDLDYWGKFGIEKTAPIYIGLMFNLINKLKHKDNIIFLSRDGYFPCLMYKIIKNYYKSLPEEKYIYASRRAYIYPSLIDDKNKIIDLLLKNNEAFGEKLTLNDIFKNLNINHNVYIDITEKYDIDIKSYITDKNLNLAKQVLLDLWDEIHKQLSNEKEILLKYLQNEGVLKYNEINVFDIGWAGSTHKALIKLTGKKIYGYYFGTSESMSSDIKKESSGYAFNVGRPINLRNKVLNNVMIYELLFTAPHGSLKNFDYDEKNNIIPVLKDVQSNYTYECVKKFQKSSLEILKILLQYKDYIIEEFSKEFIFESINNFISEKSIVDMIEFEKITNMVSIGESDNIKSYVSRVNYKDYMSNIKYYNKVAKKNLWKGALIIQDKNNRLFNINEFKKLNDLKFTYIYYEKINTIFIIIKKIILNPRKCIKKIKNILGISN